jgi:hypothetical protein
MTAVALVLSVGAPLVGCNGPHPFVRDGDANSVDVFYSGDVATAWPAAREHCAQYERVPKYVDAALGIASFKCVPR